MLSAKHKRTNLKTPQLQNGGSIASSEKPEIVARQVQPGSGTIQNIAPAWVTMVADGKRPVVGAENVQPVERASSPSIGSGSASFAAGPLIAATPAATFIANRGSVPTAMPAVATSTSLPQPNQLASKPNSNQQMTQWTEKVLIAAVSIGGTLILAFILLLIYRWRKGKELFRFFRKNDDIVHTEPQPQYGDRTGAAWNDSREPEYPYPSSRDKPAWEMNSSSGSLLYKPGPAYVRPDTATSSRPSLLGLQQQPSRSPFPPPNRIASPSPLAERSVLFFDRSESRQQFTPTPPPLRRASLTSSSVKLPIDGPRKQTDSPKRRSSVSSIAPLERMRLKDFSSSKPSLNDTWNSAQTHNHTDISRFSIATSISSAPRHRTVESWVGQQAGRFDEYQFQEHLEREIEHKFNSANASTASLGGYPKTATTVTVRRINEPRNMNSPYYMPHPGTEVPMPQTDRIPSAILDERVGPREL